MDIEFTTAEPALHAHIRDLLIEMGWGERLQDPERFAAMMSGAGRSVVALAGGRVVGFARALFDGASNGYISTVAVASDFQRQGIGRAMIERLMNVPEPERITWVLRAGRDSAGFWEKLGFNRSAIAMEKLRTR